MRLVMNEVGSVCCFIFGKFLTALDGFLEMLIVLSCPNFSSRIFLIFSFESSLLVSGGALGGGVGFKEPLAEV